MGRRNAYTLVLRVDGTQVTIEEIRQMMQAMDIDGDGEVSYDEFVTTMIDWTLVSAWMSSRTTPLSPTAPRKHTERE